MFDCQGNDTKSMFQYGKGKPRNSRAYWDSSCASVELFGNYTGITTDNILEESIRRKSRRIKLKLLLLLSTLSVRSIYILGVVIEYE